MNKNKLSFKKIQLYVVAVSLCLFCLVYFRVYDEQKKEAEAIENESHQVMEQVTERKILLEEEEKLKERIPLLQKVTKEILNSYPSDLSIPSGIMFTVQLENETKIKTKSLSITDATVFHETTVPKITNDTKKEGTDESIGVEIGEQKLNDVDKTTQEDGYYNEDSENTEGANAQDNTTDEEMPQDMENENQVDEYGKLLDSPYMRGIKNVISFNYEASYEQLVDCISFINQYPNKITINSISMSFDTKRGVITGDMNLSLYAVQGNGKAFVEPDLDYFEIGKEQIFDTISGNDLTETEDDDLPNTNDNDLSKVEDNEGEEIVE